MSQSVAPLPAKTPGNMFVRTVHAISEVCGWAAAAMTVIALFITCHMIFVRSVLGQSTIWQTEAVIMIVIGATAIGLPYVQKMRGHVNVDLVPLMLPPLGRRILAYTVLAVSMAVIALVTWYSWEIWHQAWLRNWKSSTVWAPPLWIAYLALPIGFGLLVLQLLADFVSLVTDADAPFGVMET